MRAARAICHCGRPVETLTSKLMTISLNAQFRHSGEHQMSIYEAIESTDSRRHLQLRSPITLEKTGELVCANDEDVASAIAKARAAQPA